MSVADSDTRPLTPAERHLVLWMLEHGDPEAKGYLGQLDKARVTSWKCPCGCASFNLVVEGHPLQSGGIRPIADFLFGDNDDFGIFAYHRGDVLAGVEVFGCTADAPSFLPLPEALHPYYP